MKKFLIPLLFFAATLAAEVSDPYRWLEEDSKETETWVETQKEFTDTYFSKLSYRKAVANKIKHIAAFDRRTLPEKMGDVHYFLERGQMDNKYVLIQKKEGKERILIDPNGSAEEVFLCSLSISSDGKFLAYAFSIAGSDQSRWHLFDLEKNEHLPEIFTQTRFSPLTWDGTSLLYIQDYKKLYRHILGDNIKEDSLLYTSLPGYRILQAEPLFEGRYILLTVRPPGKKQDRIVLVDLEDPDFALPEAISNGDFEVNFIGEVKDTLVCITDEGCCYGKLIAIDREGEVKTLIEEREAVLHDALIINDHIACTYYKNAIAELWIFDLEGNVVEQLPLSEKGTVHIKSSKNSPCLYYSIGNFISPKSIYEYNLETKEHSLFFAPKLNFDPSIYTTKQIFYTSKDGTRVPMFVTHKKDLLIDETTPVLLYGYGGFGLSQTPTFRSDFLTWVDAEGVLVVPCLRGGKEYGKAWYEQGRQHNKQNVFDDFISAAEFLIANRVGSRKTLAIFGSSNGGLLTGACMTQRPDLFKAVVVNKGVLDMLRFHLFTCGKFWVGDFGNPEDPLDYAYLLTYSPYHNLRKGTHYPSTLVNTADHDDRVVPLHSYKFAAALQEANGSEHPILLRLETSFGHVGSASQEQEIAFGTDMLCFLTHELYGKKP